MKETSYWVYILHCANDAYYTGYTTNLARRYQDHCNGSSKCRYTRSFKPLRMAQCWLINGDKALALRVEIHIKKLSRAQKLHLISAPECLAQLFPVEPGNIIL